MIIGVDAGALCVSDERLKVGVWRLTLNLLEELGTIDTVNMYRLYSFRPIERMIFNRLGRNMHPIVLQPSAGWSSVRLPVELALHPVDVFLGLSQVVPASSVYNIGFIYDVGFLHRPQDYPDSLNKLTKQTKNLVERSDRIVTISSASKNDIIDHYQINRDKIDVCYPGVDPHFIPKGEKHKRKNPYFLFVGALKRGKNLPLALEAYAVFLKKIQHVHDFVIVGGDYWRDPAIDATIERLQLEDRVQFTGHVSDEILATYYRGAIALLITSHWEGFCLPAVEAMMCGCPVLATNSGSLPEVIGKAGIIISEENSGLFCKFMVRLAESKSLRSKLITAELVRAKQFTWRKFAQQVLDVIEGAAV